MTEHAKTGYFYVYFSLFIMISRTTCRNHAMHLNVKKGGKGGWGGGGVRQCKINK